MALWADYSGGRPTGAALRAAGFAGVIRYVGLGGSAKRITADEYRELRSAGIDVLLVAELATGDAWGGYSAGLANARAALDDARALGIPDTIGIAAAADAHAANQGQIAAAVEYTRGFRDVLGLGRTGFYGFVETSNAVRAAGVASWHWRCGAYPDAAARTWVHFWQRNSGLTTTSVSGVTCDINDQLNPLPYAAPTPTPGSGTTEEDTMITVPAGTDDHVNLIVAGKTGLAVACSWNRTVQVHSLQFYGATGTDPNGTGVGGAVTNAVIDSNRPGPLPVPSGAVMATLRYTADHSFGVGTV